MPLVSVIALFDDLPAAQKARQALVDAGLVQPVAVHIEGNELEREGLSKRVSDWLERLRELLPSASDSTRAAYAEGLRRGGYVLIAHGAGEDAEEIERILRRYGAVDLEERMNQWRATGWLGFEIPPPLPEQLITEPEPAPPVCIDEHAAAAAGGAAEDDPTRTVRLFDEGTGKELGRISDAELKVLQDALETQGPDDNEYWINSDEIDDLACRPGATPHLIALLRAALDGRPEGIDIAYQPEGEPRQSFRRTNAAGADRSQVSAGDRGA